ncbi:hypothetical protein L917_17660 [Phytophthora nicotianae]|uniref:Uncharacterized protein n=1 Tax=Phytophthora nicotianae TaxID=4792 RepID=W2KA71_PHYNI|nr:hypothetical protein L917_17660 [Phytophthora nicotianae]ETM35320.1 hypothetical protein L914_17746 [Phytophthora nicotianae]
MAMLDLSQEQNNKCCTVSTNFESECHTELLRTPISPKPTGVVTWIYATTL